MMPTSEKHVTLVLVPYAFSFPQIELGTYLSEGKMLCTKCKSDTKVAESRPRNETTWRRRKCLSCGTQFRTIEILEPVVAQPKPKSKPKPEPKPKTNEEIIQEFVDKGVHKVSVKMLTKAGYNTRNLRELGERLNGFVLRKSNYDLYYKITVEKQ